MPGLAANTPRDRPFLDQLFLVTQAGTRTDQAHLALQHIPEPRQLIKFCPPDKIAEWRDGGCVSKVRGHRGRIHLHGTELDQYKGFLAAPHAPLPEERRAGIEKADQGQTQQQRGADHQAKGGKQNVEKARHHEVPIILLLKSGLS